ncbi:hypothetical protein HZB02_02580 [Candidatus Woesearchaeota archaeon]|nr:hypothetical protein [Candidatus Woesearchaeota archaeon]
MRFCPKCGKKGIIGDFCEDCAPPTAALFPLPELKACVHCTSLLYKHKKLSGSLEEMLAAVVYDQHKKKVKVKLADKEVIIKPGLAVPVNLLIRGNPVQVKIFGTYCEQCKGINDSTYYEAIIQLRDCSDEVLQFVQNIFHTHHAKPSKIEPVRGGVDIYVRNQGFAKMVGKRLKEHVPGHLHISHHLVTYDHLRSRDLHRATLYFTQLKHKKGDHVLYKGEMVEILSVGGKRIAARGLETGKKYDLEYGELVKSS